MKKVRTARGTFTAYEKRIYFLPTIEWEQMGDGRNYLTINFGIWYFGLYWETGNR